MSKPYDATTRRLLELDPRSWLACAGMPETGPIRVLDSDLSTVTAEADATYQVGEPADYLAHIELQTGHDRTIPQRLLHYNVLLNYRHDLPVRSVVILLRRGADSPSFTGHHQVGFADGSSYLDFRYSVLRIWTLDPEIFLRSGLGVLPLAPLANVEQANLPALIDRIKIRLDREVSEPEAGLLWTATSVLMGLRFPSHLVKRLLQGVQSMKESTVYQAILEEGRVGVKVETERMILIRIGRARFGEPTPDVLDRIAAVSDELTLTTWIDRVVLVSSWEELLS